VQESNFMFISMLAASEIDVVPQLVEMCINVDLKLCLTYIISKFPLAHWADKAQLVLVGLNVLSEVRVGVKDLAAAGARSLRLTKSINEPVTTTAGHSNITGYQQPNGKARGYAAYVFYFPKDTFVH